MKPTHLGVCVGLAVCCFLAWLSLKQLTSRPSNSVPPSFVHGASENLDQQVQTNIEISSNLSEKNQSSQAVADRKFEIDNLIEESVSGVISSNPESKLYLKHLEGCISEKGKQIRAFRIASYFGARFRDLTTEETEIEIEKRIDSDPKSIKMFSVRLDEVRTKKSNLFVEFAAAMRRIGASLTSDDLAILFTFRPQLEPKDLLGVSEQEFFEE